MSRSGYTDDIDGWELIRYRGAVASAIRGKRGQRLLRELAEAMDAMPVKELIAYELEADGAHCALGVVGAKRGLDLAKIDAQEPELVAKAFNIATALAAEIEYENDECACWNETGAERWIRMRQWVAEQIGETNAARD